MSSAAADDAPVVTSSQLRERRSVGQRPLLSTPRHLHAREFVAEERDRLARQPLLGAAGLLFVIPLTVLLAVGVDGAEKSMLVLAPIVLFAMPVIFMTIFWWEDWPGSKRRARQTGRLDVLFIGLAAIYLTALGQVVVAHFDLRSIFDPRVGPGRVPTFPATMPVAGVAFVAMVEITLVSERWPLRRLGTLIGGLSALAISWGVAIGVYHAAFGFVSGGRLGALLVLIGLWQVWFFLVWRGWPISSLGRRWQRLWLGNATVLIGGVGTYAAGRALGASPLTLNALASCLIAAAVVVAVLFEGSPIPTRLAHADRLVISTLLLLVAAGLYLGLRAWADQLQWRQGSPLQWVSHITLALVAVVLLHVAVGGRWPFTQAQRENRDHA
jgi:hypothetical protein